MKTLLALVLFSISPLVFSQYKIPAVDLNTPPKSAPTTTISTVEETAPKVEPEKANGCTMNFTNTKGLFIQDKKRFQSMTPLEKDYDKQIVKQGVIMGSGTEVRFVKSLCTHYIIVINMIPKKLQNGLPHQLFRQALTIITAFQSEREQKVELYPLRKALARNNWELIKSEGDQYILPCEGAKCTLKVINDKEIEVTYDVGA